MIEIVFGDIYFDYMDLFLLGGEEFICNIVYVCVVCNMLKGWCLFVDWFNKFMLEYCVVVIVIYIEKYGYLFEVFVRKIKFD